MLTTEGAPYTADNEELKMDVEDVDMTKWTEDEFEEKCTYIVKDHTWEGPLENTGLTRAEASLPRNLAFKHPADSKEVWHGITHDALMASRLPFWNVPQHSSGYNCSPAYHLLIIPACVYECANSKSTNPPRRHCHIIKLQEAALSRTLDGCDFCLNSISIKPHLLITQMVLIFFICTVSPCFVEQKKSLSMSVCLIISNSHCYSANTNIHTSEQHMTSSSSTRVQKLRGELLAIYQTCFICGRQSTNTLLSTFPALMTAGALNRIKLLLFSKCL